MNEVLELLTNKHDEMVERLRDIVELETPSLDKKLTDQAAKEIAKFFEQYTGGKAEFIQNEQYGNHVKGTWGEGDDQILLLAHFDTVWREGDIKRKPFEIKDGKAYGPGVFDMKGGLVQGVFALHALKELNQQAGKVVFLFNSDEEIGSPTSQKLIEEEAKKSKAVFVLEPAMSTEGSLKTERKGVGIFEVNVKGTPAHSGIDPEKGKSAIGELASHITYLHSLTDFDKGTTVNVGVVEGGTTSNVVAASAKADVDLRVRYQSEFDRMLPLIKEIEPTTEGVEVEVNGGINRPPFERSEKVAYLANIAKQLAKDELGFELTEKATGGGSDGNFTAPIAPTLDGLGAVGDGAHAEHEHLYVSEMPKRSALVALLINHFLKEEK
ncbi:M20 family metallopeptidase [Salirhabdus salicampi]|uniref:M20 family metallopeptidase n=1 Tax=Salirhabdus salicampi TaxID=476102 RepID=UPI0020C20AE1|nr:M20 family metallopeptidase [Salirhabdus salicampi]MCP8615707.1 M20 family metallopeptidase [Salirhabdus salicampi]